jgi:DNA-binding transcriptional MerR regulator
MATPRRREAATTDDEMPIDELARVAQLPVRTIREYQTMRLLPPPERRGRVGFYGAAHRERLALISRLQARGYSLAGIGDLLASFEAGANLPALLGVDIAPAAIDEAPLRITRDELRDRVPGLGATALKRACVVGLVVRENADHYLVRSPALLALVADGIAAGASLEAMLDLAGELRDQLDVLATTIADRVIDDIWEPRASTERAVDLEPFLRRGRVLLLQAVASVLADRLGNALSSRSATATAGDELRAGIDRIRVGAVVNGRGNVEHRRQS